MFSLVPELARNWWLFMLRGLISILFGIFCIASPASMTASIVLVWGIFALVDGVIVLGYALFGRAQEHRWLMALQGLLGIVFGILAVAFPVATTIGIILYIAVWAFMVGSLTIAAAIANRKEIEGEFWLGLAGLLTILFGVFAVINPGVAAISLTWVLGIYAVAFGIAMIAFAFRVKKLRPAN